MEGVSCCKIFMNSFCEFYFLNCCLPNWYLFILDAFFNILPYLIILLNILGSEYTILSFAGCCFTSILFGDLLYDFIFILSQPLLLFSRLFLSLFLFQQCECQLFFLFPHILAPFQLQMLLFFDRFHDSSSFLVNIRKYIVDRLFFFNSFLIFQFLPFFALESH